jgi:hypothetical protein
VGEGGGRAFYYTYIHNFLGAGLALAVVLFGALVLLGTLKLGSLSKGGGWARRVDDRSGSACIPATYSKSQCPRSFKNDTFLDVSGPGGPLLRPFASLKDY